MEGIKEQLKVVSIDTAAHLVGKGPAAIRKALRESNLLRRFDLCFGDACICLLDLNQVMVHWPPTGKSQWYHRRLNDIKQDTFFVRTTDYVLEVCGGSLSITSPQTNDR